MIYEVRTYTLRPGGAVAEFEERFAKRLPLREKHSKLGAFWHTEFGPLNQVIHVYPYDDLQQRTAVRADQNAVTQVWMDVLVRRGLRGVGQRVVRGDAAELALDDDARHPARSVLQHIVNQQVSLIPLRFWRERLV